MRNLEHICFRKDKKQSNKKKIEENMGRAEKTRTLPRASPAFP